MSKIESLFGQFNSNEERNRFMESQLTVITNLTKTVEEQKSKIKHLEDLLKDATRPLPSKEEQIISNEELIAKEQVAMLRVTSSERDLTLEEVRKLDTYVKILLALKETKKNQVSPAVAGMDAKALLKLVEDTN